MGPNTTYRKEAGQMAFLTIRIHGQRIIHNAEKLSFLHVRRFLLGIIDFSAHGLKK